MKDGDKVRRKKEFQNTNRWDGGDDIFTASNVSSSTFFVNGVCWDIDKFELITGVLTLEAQITATKDIVGKEVFYYLDDDYVSFVVQSKKVITEVYRSDSEMVKDAMKNAVAVVVLHGPMGENIPYTVVQDIGEVWEEVKLNENYTAKVFRDKIEVGCQTFPISIIQELNFAYNRL